MPSFKAIKSFLPFVIIGFVAALTITIGAMLYRAKRVAAVTMSEEQTVAAQATDSVHARGAAFHAGHASPRDGGLVAFPALRSAARSR